jgi:SPP1 family predicted phage head-tail adaptor
MDRLLFPHRVTVETRTETDDGHGGQNVTWAVLHSRVPARVRPLLGRDLERAQQVDPRISHEVSMRFWRAHSTDLAGGRARLIYHPSSVASEDRRFEIIGAPVDVEEAHERLVMPCKEAA